MFGTITDEQVEQLTGALDLDDEAVYARYSGRAMYGATCFGLVIDTPDVVVGVALAEVFGDDAWDIARAARTDNMGYSTIVYFPGWKLADDTGYVEHEDVEGEELAS